MEPIKRIRVFLSCPSDIKEECNSVQQVIDETNKISGKHQGYMIDLVIWTTNTFGGKAEYPQEVINQQNNYDILVGIIGQRIGSPTPVSVSGTVEEINIAIESEKHHLLYFNTSATNIKTLDLAQLAKVNSFKQELSDKGVLFHEFESIEIFENLFRIHLPNLIFDKLLVKEPVLQSSAADKYASYSELIEEVEKPQINDVDNLDILTLSEDFGTSLSTITFTMLSMANSMSNLTNNINARLPELKLVNHIKDDRLRQTKSQIIDNSIATMLEDFNKRINLDLTDFTTHFLRIGPNYSILFLYLSQFNIPEVHALKDSCQGFRDQVESSLGTIASLLRTVMATASRTYRFNKARRETEIVLKNLTKELLQGLRLLDEAVKHNIKI